MKLAGLGLVDMRPISYLGVDPKTALLFSISLIASSVFFITFGHYVANVYHLSAKFMTYLVIGQAGQIVAAIIPYGGTYKTIHTIAAFILAFSLPLLIREFARAQDGSNWSSISVRLLRIEQISFFVGLGLFVFTRGIAPIGEALPAIGFHIWIIAVTTHKTSLVN